MVKIEDLIKEIKDIKGPKNGTLKFEKKIAMYRNQEYYYYEMNREAFSLLAMSFTGKKALLWRIKFNNAFYEMERLLTIQQANHNNELWQNQRKQGIKARNEETDIIKEFVEYSEKQGNTQAKWIYSNITRATYKILRLVQTGQPKQGSLF